MKDAGVRFHLLSRGRRTLAVAPAFREEAPYLFEGIDAAGPVAWVEGRRRHPVVALPDGRRLVVRALVHGGLLGGLLGRLFWGLNRPLREFVATVRAGEKGIPVPTAVGARVERLPAGFYRGDVLSLEIAGCQDLGDLLRGAWDAWPRWRRDRAIRAAAAALRRMHDAGMYHPDLNLKNVLVRAEGDACAAFFVDLDRARFYREITFRLRRKNLWRLGRSAEKLARPGKELSRPDRLRFLLGYAGEDAAMREKLVRSFRLIPATSFGRRLWWSLKDGA